MPGETHLHPEGAFLTGRGSWWSRGPNPETVLNIFLSVSVCVSASLCPSARGRQNQGPKGSGRNIQTGDSMGPGLGY